MLRQNALHSLRSIDPVLMWCAGRIGGLLMLRSSATRPAAAGEEMVARPLTGSPQIVVEGLSRCPDQLELDWWPNVLLPNSRPVSPGDGVMRLIRWPLLLELLLGLDVGSGVRTAEPRSNPQLVAVRRRDFGDASRVCALSRALGAMVTDAQGRLHAARPASAAKRDRRVALLRLRRSSSAYSVFNSGGA